MFSDPLCLQDPACHMVSNYEPGCALGTRSLILNQETRHLREPAYDSIPDEEPTFQRDVVYQPASNEPRCLQVPARSSIPHSAPRHLRNLASCLKPNQKPKSLNISSPNQESDTKLEKQPEVLHIETERAGMTWTSRLLELANTEFDSVPIYSSLPFNPLLSPEKQFQVNLTVGKICVNAEGPSHETACDTAARKAVHILTGSTDPNSVAPINDVPADVPQAKLDTNSAEEKKRFKLKYSSSPFSILEKVAAMLSKTVEFSSPTKGKGNPPKSMCVICSFGHWSINGWGPDAESAKLVAGKAMLSHLYRNNACGINWPAAIKMLDYNETTIKPAAASESKPAVNIQRKPVTNNKKSPISRLYEFQQKRKEDGPVFHLVEFKLSEQGVTEHSVRLTVGSLTVIGKGATLKAAEIAAAVKVIDIIASYGADV